VSGLQRGGQDSAAGRVGCLAGCGVQREEAAGEGNVVGDAGGRHCELVVCEVDWRRAGDGGGCVGWYLYYDPLSNDLKSRYEIYRPVQAFGLVVREDECG